MNDGRKARRIAFAVLLALALGALACSGGGSDDWMLPTPTAVPAWTPTATAEPDATATPTPTGLEGYDDAKATPGAVDGRGWGP